MNKNTLLMIPGPVMVESSIMEEFSTQPLPHRSEEFSKILKESFGNLKYLFQTKNDVFILTSSGTGAMCAALENLLNPNDKVLCLINGVFSSRWKDIAISQGAEVDTIEVPFGEVITPESLEKKLTENKYKIVTMAHCETSTGAANDIRKLCKIISKHDALSVVDGISSIGAMECKTDDWDIDVLISASQKGFGLPPGLSFISVSGKAFEMYKKTVFKPYYFDFGKYKLALDNNTVPYTPAVNQIRALHRALNNIKEEGLENLIKRRKRYNKILRAELENLGLKLMPRDDKLCASSVCAAYSPQNISVEGIRDYLKNKHNIIIANGQQELKDKIFRIGTLGDIDESDIKRTISAIKECILSSNT